MTPEHAAAAVIFAAVLVMCACMVPSILHRIRSTR